MLAVTVGNWTVTIDRWTVTANSITVTECSLAVTEGSLNTEWSGLRPCHHRTVQLSCRINILLIIIDNKYLMLC